MPQHAVVGEIRLQEPYIRFLAGQARTWRMLTVENAVFRMYTSKYTNIYNIYYIITYIYSICHLTMCSAYSKSHHPPIY